MKAVIVAGGRGSRMKTLCKSIPKPMLPIAGRPVLEYHIERLRDNSIFEVYFLVGYMGHVIQDYFGDGRDFGVDIRYCFEDVPLGTAGSVKQLEGVIKEDFLVIYGDLMWNVKLDDLIGFHRKKQSHATLIVHPNDHPYDSDVVILDNTQKLNKFIPKAEKPRYYPNMASAAFYMLSPAVFPFISDGYPSDFIKDVFPAMLEKSRRIYGYKTAEYIKDMGTPKRLETIQMDLRNGKFHRISKRRKQPAIFIDRDGTLIEDVNLLHKPESLRLFPFSSSALKALNNAGLLCFLVTNQPVVARNLCDIEKVKQIHHKLETLLGQEGAYLNDIFFCPHHPDKGYAEENPEYKTACDCRKPEIGMIRKAELMYNVDKSASWFIGDTTTDLQTARNAGMKGVLVLTGKGGKDGKYSLEPDYVFDDLAQAVDFILKLQELYKQTAHLIYAKLQAKNGLIPHVVSVGGQARSGKSVFSRYLKSFLESKGLSSSIIGLDNWIVGLDKRNESMELRERFQYDKTAMDIDVLLNNGVIQAAQYDPYSRKIVGKRTFSIHGKDCLILEGVPALDIEALRKRSTVNVFVDTDEKTRKKRFEAFYSWKDVPKERLEAIYLNRQQDEFPIIETSRQYADFIVRN